MAGDKVATLAKPQLRRLLQNQIKINLAVAVGLAAVAGVAMKFLYNDARKKAYADFYKTYDIDKECEQIRAKGLFDSC